MLYHLLYPLHIDFSAFNLFRYITVRSGFAGATALILSFIFAPKFIKYFSNHKLFSGVRDDSISSQKQKVNIPTMGGIVIIAVSVISTLLWANLKESFVWIALFSFVSLGILGFSDDLRKIKKGKGIRAIYKIIWQIAIGICVGVYMVWLPKDPALHTTTSLLFVKNIFLYLGCLYIPFVILVVVGTSNATNLSDGLDGLSIGLIVEVALAYAILAYAVGNMKVANYLNVLYIPGTGELTVFLTAIVGAGLGFLWFNIHPAQIIMGDTGALALGGAIGTCAVAIKQEILLAIAGGVFVIEVMSVVLQVIYFKRTHGKRLFRMTPIHHHYEKLGVPEEKLVVRFWIVGILFLLVALATLKIR